MAYKDMKTVYYTEKDRYMDEYERRIGSDEAVKTGFEIENTQAFFMMTRELNEMVFDILRMDKRIAELRQMLPGVAVNQFIRRCLIDEIVLTNKMEGVYSTRKEVDEVLQNLAENSGKKNRLRGLILNYAQLQKNGSKQILKCEDIRELYDETVLQEVEEDDPQNKPDGKIFRKDAAVVRSATDRVIHRGTYPEGKIIQKMEQAIRFLNDSSVEPIYRIAAFHYMLEYIHPFYDGNGRLGRFIVSNLLVQYVDPIIAVRISYTIEENKNEYYKAFKVCNARENMGDMTPFLMMMVKMIHRSMESLEEALQKRKIALENYKDLRAVSGRDKKLNKIYFYLVQAALFAEHGIFKRELKREMNCGDSAIQSALKKIDATGMLVCKQVGHEKCYSIDLQKLDAALAVEK